MSIIFNFFVHKIFKIFLYSSKLSTKQSEFSWEKEKKTTTLWPYILKFYFDDSFVFLNQNGFLTLETIVHSKEPPPPPKKRCS